jgi:acetyl-CoA acetyltransferase
MAMTFNELRPVYVVGTGLDRYRRVSERSYVEFGLIAIRAAMADAGIQWRDVESFYLGTALLGMAPGRTMIKHLGATGTSIAQVENASASGSTSFRQACLDVASGVADVAMAAGVDKPARMHRASDGSVGDLVGRALPPVAHFALLANQYCTTHGVTTEQMAAVAVKNHRNGALNPYAHRQKARTLEEVLAPPFIAGSLTRLQCCPVGEGAAAVIVASEDAIERLGIDPARSVRVLASVSRSERVYAPDADGDVELTRETVAMAYAQSGIEPGELDVVELHDAFSIEEIMYAEAMGLSGRGEGARDIVRGDFDIGGRCAISASGGLLAMGHPIGPTGTGQIVEITRQLRGEAGDRQQPDATTGLAHMVGVGAVCLVHILQRA